MNEDVRIPGEAPWLEGAQGEAYLRSLHHRNLRRVHSLTRGELAMRVEHDFPQLVRSLQRRVANLLRAAAAPEQHGCLPAHVLVLQQAALRESAVLRDALEHQRKALAYCSAAPATDLAIAETLAAEDAMSSRAGSAVDGEDMQERLVQRLDDLSMAEQAPAEPVFADDTGHIAEASECGGASVAETVPGARLRDVDSQNAPALELPGAEPAAVHPPGPALPARQVVYEAYAVSLQREHAGSMSWVESVEAASHRDNVAKTVCIVEGSGYCVALEGSDFRDSAAGESVPTPVIAAMCVMLQV